MLMPSIFGENLFDDFMSDFPFFDDRDLRKTERKLYGHNAKRLMKTDIKETDSGFELEMDLPGFKKDEIKVSLDNGYMTVSAAKGLDKDEQEKKSGKYIRRERYAGACERSFYVGENVTAQRKDDMLQRLPDMIRKAVTRQLIRTTEYTYHSIPCS